MSNSTCALQPMTRRVFAACAGLVLFGCSAANEAGTIQSSVETDDGLDREGGAAASSSVQASTVGDECLDYLTRKYPGYKFTPGSEALNPDFEFDPFDGEGNGTALFFAGSEGDSDNWQTVRVVMDKYGRLRDDAYKAFFWQELDEAVDAIIADNLPENSYEIRVHGSPVGDVLVPEEYDFGSDPLDIIAASYAHAEAVVTINGDAALSALQAAFEQSGIPYSVTANVVRGFPDDGTLFYSGNLSGYDYETVVLENMRTK